AVSLFGACGCACACGWAAAGPCAGGAGGGGAVESFGVVAVRSGGIGLRFLVLSAVDPGPGVPGAAAAPAGWSVLAAGGVPFFVEKGDGSTASARRSIASVPRTILLRRRRGRGRSRSGRRVP